MRNLAFTCDLCGRQFDYGDEGATLSFRPASAETKLFSDASSIIRFNYDFCEDCAQSIGTQIKEFISEKGVTK